MFTKINLNESKNNSKLGFQLIDLFTHADNFSLIDELMINDFCEKLDVFMFK